MHLHDRAVDRYVGAQAQRVLERAGGSRVRILDVGCGSMPYRKYFDRDPRCAAYDGADIEGATTAATIRIDATTQAIGAAAATYDAVVSFQVLEHSSHPLALLRECRRILRPGGELFMTVPFMFEYHGVPRDFRRWTHEGIVEDLVDCGFSDASAEPVESDLQSLTVMNQLLLARLFGYVVTKPVFMAINAAALCADRLVSGRDLRLVPLTLGVRAARGTM